MNKKISYTKEYKMRVKNEDITYNVRYTEGDDFIELIDGKFAMSRILRLPMSVLKDILTQMQELPK